MAKSDSVARVLAMAAIGQGGGEPGTTDYEQLTNKPSINGIELSGNKTASDLKVASNAAISDVEYEASTGILTFSQEDGNQINIDLPLELLIESGRYDEATKSIILTLANGQEISINVEDLITIYGSDGETIEMYVKDGINTFKIADAILEKINNIPVIDEVTISKNAEGKIQVIGIKDTKTDSANQFWTGTKAEYDALGTYDENTFYAITDEVSNSPLSISSEMTDVEKIDIMEEACEVYAQGIIPNLTYVDSTTGKLFNVYDIDKYDSYINFYVQTGDNGVTNYGVGYYVFDRYKIKCDLTNNAVSAVTIEEMGNMYGLADNAEILGINNTTEFTPEQNYQPATKKYVDDSAVSIDETTISKNAEGKIEVLGVKDIKTNLIDNFWTGTRAEYNALETKEENVFYAITDDDDVVTKAEVGAELDASYTDDMLTLSLLNPYSQSLSKTEVLIPTGVFNYKITLTEDTGGIITADKTIDEIKTAQNAGDMVYVSYNNSLIPLVFVGDNTLKFTMISDAQSITISCDGDVWSVVTNNLLPITGGTMTGALTLYGDPVENDEATTKAYVDSKIVSSQYEHNTLYYATIDGTNDNWYSKDKLQPVLQAAYDGGYHDIMIRTTTGSRFITSSGLDLQSISETVSGNLQFVNLQNLTGSTTTPNTLFYGYCYANTVKLDSEGNVVISGSVGKTGGSIKVMKESALTDIAGYDASATQVLKNVNGTLTWATEG